MKTEQLTDSIKFINSDCMDVMAEYPGKYFDLAIVDPPYGIGQNWKKDKHSKFHNHTNGFNNSTPGAEYFDELFRVSKHQIIWGANYYWNFLEPSNNLIFWDKKKDTISQKGSAGEIAWTSIKKYPLIKVELAWNGAVICEKTSKVHPHQKPVKLYEWIYHNYAKPEFKILDTHLGSGSNAIAAHNYGIAEFVGIELDPEYYVDSIKRFNRVTAQLRMF